MGLGRPWRIKGSAWARVCWSWRQGYANAGAGNRGATAPELRHRRLKTLGLDGTYEQWMRANNYQQPPHSN
jgi:hypothetical protein